MALTQVSSDVLGTLANLTVTGNITADSVGVGTNSPGGDTNNKVVKVAGSGSGSFRAVAGPYTLTNIQYNGTAGTVTDCPFYTIGTQSPGSVVFNTDATERVRIDTNGNVGIGTSSPTEKLHVVGNVIVTGNVTAPNFSGTANNASFLGGIPAANFANIAAFASSFTMPGYQKLPGGLIIQWLTVSEGTSQGSITANYPIAFPNAFLAASVSSTNTGASSNADIYFQFVSSTTSAITVYRQQVNNNANTGAMIIALGY
jgi:hypothetical protein